MLQLTAVTLGLSSLALAHMQPGVHRAHDGFAKRALDDSRGFVKRRANFEKRECCFPTFAGFDRGGR